MVNRARHCVLQSVHPSPLSAPRGFVSLILFFSFIFYIHSGVFTNRFFSQFDCGHFQKTNEWLVKRYGEGGAIDWNLNVSPEKTGL